MLVAGGLLVLNASLIEMEPRRSDIEVVSLACTALARAAIAFASSCAATVLAIFCVWTLALAFSRSACTLAR